MGKSQRVMGHQWERDVAILLRPVYPLASRGLQYKMDRPVPDVDNTDYWVECKVGAAPNIRAAFKQSERDKEQASDLRPPLVVTKRHYERPVASMYLDDFINLLRKACMIPTAAQMDFIQKGMK